VIAEAVGCHRRTVVTILNELRDAGRIETKPLGQHGGLTILINPGVIYSETQEAVSAVEMPQIALSAPTPEETTEYNTCVSSETARADHSSPTLRDLAANYLDQPPAEIGQRCVSRRTGQIMYRRTAKHFAALVVGDYGDRYTFDTALDAYAAEQQRRKDEAAKTWQRFFARLRQMTNDELIAYIAGRCRTEAHELAREGSTFDKHLYQVRLKCARQQLAWRGVPMPTRKTRIEQQAREDAERAEQARKKATPPKQRLRACQQVRYEHPAPADPGPAMRASLFKHIRAIEAH